MNELPEIFKALENTHKHEKDLFQWLNEENSPQRTLYGRSAPVSYT